MEKLELKKGDKVYLKTVNRWNRDEVHYRLDEVVRTTRTQAILSSGIRLINKATIDWSKELSFSEHGERYTKWKILTDDVLEDSKKQKERQFLNNWFSKRKFTDEEIKIIYQRFKELNLLDVQSSSNEG